jgi:arylsulfatase A
VPCLPNSPWEPTPDSKETSYREKTIGKKGDPKYFDDMLSYFDKQVGIILASLEELGVADNTIVMFLADNGTGRNLVNLWGDGKKIRVGKGIMNDRGTHVRLIVRWPGRTKSGATCDDMVDFSDLFPTLCELTGAPMPEAKLHGRRFSPQLLGKPSEPREWIHIQNEEGRQVRSDD